MPMPISTSTNKNALLFSWFIKSVFLKPRDEYSLHDSVKSKFCPEFLTEEELDEKEQLLRDTPGPAGIKYAYYIGKKVNGLSGSFVAISALLIPFIAIASVFSFIYINFISTGTFGNIPVKALNGMSAAALGLIIAHLYKLIYFNHVNQNKKTMIFILPSAFIFIFLSDITGVNNSVLIPFSILAVLVLGTIFGVVQAASVKYREKHPKYIDPRSKKGKKLRERQLRAEELELRRDIHDDTIKRRKKQLEDEEKKRKRDWEE